MIDIPMNPPTRIGRYEIIRRLGKSMTDVYLAMDTVENRKVALKLVPRNGDRATRLVMEAERRGAAIQQELHTSDPRMVEIYDCLKDPSSVWRLPDTITTRSRHTVTDQGGAPRPSSSLQSCSPSADRKSTRLNS